MIATVCECKENWRCREKLEFYNDIINLNCWDTWTLVLIPPFYGHCIATRIVLPKDEPGNPYFPTEYEQLLMDDNDLIDIDDEGFFV